jgi:hypothetical protein
MLLFLHHLFDLLGPNPLRKHLAGQLVFERGLNGVRRLVIELDYLTD